MTFAHTRYDLIIKAKHSESKTQHSNGILIRLLTKTAIISDLSYVLTHPQLNNQV